MTHETYDTDTHVAVKKHHLRLALAFTLLLIVGAGVAGAWFYRGQTVLVNGRPVFTVPNFSSLKNPVQVQTPNGETIQARMEPMRCHRSSSKTTDSLESGSLERTDSWSDCYDPIARLVGTIKVDHAATQTAINGLVDQAKNLNGTVKALDKKVDGVTLRVAELEKKQTAPAPAPTAPGPVSQARPNMKVAADLGGVSPSEVAAAARAYHMLGAAPNGAQIGGFAVVHSTADFGRGSKDACPAGQKRVVVRKMHDPVAHMTYYRTKCE